MSFDLQRYNRWVGSLLGTLALVGLAALLVTGLVSLWPSRPSAGTLPAAPSANPAGPANPAPGLRFGLPREMAGTDTLLVPVEGLPQQQEEPRGLGSYSKGAPEAPLFNLLLLDARTGASRALLTAKALITRYDVLESGRGSADLALGLVLRVVTADTNGNGRLDEEDADQVYVCDPTGRNLRAVTPADSVCEAWQFDGARRTLYLRVHPRGQSRRQGEADLLAVAPEGNLPARALVSEAQRQELRNLMQQ